MNISEEIENLVLSLIDSEGKRTITNFEEKVIRDLAEEDTKLFTILQSIRQENTSSEKFRRRIESIAKQEIVRRAEFFSSAIISGAKSLEHAITTLTDLVPTHYSIDLSGTLIEKLIIADRDRRKILISNHLRIDENQIKEYYEDWLTSLRAVLGAQGKPILITKEIEEYQFEIGILCSEIINFYRSIGSPFYSYSPSSQSPLYKLYHQKGHDLNEEEQYNRYNLIQIKNNRELLDTFPRVLDQDFRISFDLSLPSPALYFALSHLRDTYNFDISFRPHNIKIYNSIERRILFMEQIEYGKIFEHEDALSKTIITKLYDLQNNDRLWVKMKNKEIIFEELLNDFLFFDEHFISNMVHMIISDDGHIQHIDHEYIFYTEDEFIRRYDDPKVKGKARPRIKTFKIDNAAIPLDIEGILYPLVQFTFKNNDLVREYFYGPSTSA